MHVPPAAEDNCYISEQNKRPPACPSHHSPRVAHNVIFGLTHVVSVLRVAFPIQGLAFTKRSDREVDGFAPDEAEAEPETIAVHSAFGAPPAEAGGGMFDSDSDDGGVW